MYAETFLYNIISQAPVCIDCGTLLSVYMEKRAPSTAAASHEKHRQWSCLHCNSGRHIEIVSIPYVFRYLVAELAAMNIKVEMDVKE